MGDTLLKSIYLNNSGALVSGLAYHKTHKLWDALPNGKKISCTWKAYVVTSHHVTKQLRETKKEERSSLWAERQQYTLAMGLRSYDRKNHQDHISRGAAHRSALRKQGAKEREKEIKKRRVFQCSLQRQAPNLISNGSHLLKVPPEYQKVKTLKDIYRHQHMQYSKNYVRAETQR